MLPKLPSTARYAVLKSVDTGIKFWSRWDRDDSFSENMRIATRCQEGSTFEIVEFCKDLEESENAAKQH